MTSDKATKLLRKIQALYDNLSDQGSMSALERDLLLSYLRELYDELSGAIPGSAVTPRNEPQQPAKSFESAPPLRPVTPPEPEISYTRPEPELVETPQPPRQPWFNEPQNAAPSPIRQEAPQPPIQESPTSVSEGSAGDDDVSLVTLFEFKQSGELSEKLKMQPLERIEQGMGINERILMINELFGGDSDLFRKTLDELNALQDFTAAKHYLVREIAPKYQWAEGARKSQAALFILLVRRRFITA